MCLLAKLFRLILDWSCLNIWGDFVSPCSFVHHVKRMVHIPKKIVVEENTFVNNAPFNVGDELMQTQYSCLNE